MDDHQYQRNVRNIAKLLLVPNHVARANAEHPEKTTIGKHTAT